MSGTSSMENIVDNLQLKDSLTCDDTHSRLLKLADSSNLCFNGKAHNTNVHKVHKFHNKNKNHDKHNPTRPVKSELPKCDQWSNGEKHKDYYEGQTHKFCNRLKSARDNYTSSAAPPAYTRNVVPCSANLTVEE